MTLKLARQDVVAKLPFGTVVDFLKKKSFGKNSNFSKFPFEFAV